MTTEHPILIAENIHKKFGSLEVLKGISLSANKGNVISILGSSGSGKSTFLRCLNFLEMPEQGKITIDDQEIVCRLDTSGKPIRPKQKQIDLIRTRLGMVFQGFNLWTHMSILQNVMEGPVQVLKQPKTEVRDKAMAYLEKVGLADKARNYPVQLSGGQKQRVAIARALAMEPEILLFDEPTSALDPELVSEVLTVIQNLAEEGSTMLIVTHEMGFAREVSDQIVFLHEGQVEEQGTPEQIFKNCESERIKQFMSSVL